MQILVLLVGIAVIGAVILDSFQTIVLPRRPVARFRLTRIFFLVTWSSYSCLVPIVRDRRKREQLYSFFGPSSLLLLFVVWAISLLSGFGLIYFGLPHPFTDPWHPVTITEKLRSCFYVSGSTLFTLGLGDVVPARGVTRVLMVMEAGTGLGFVALVIGYLPVLYTAFSTREKDVAMLDARAGSPPTAGELLLRHQFEGGEQALTELLAVWEAWCATMLETHISYPILCYYRSQHDNQSWLAAVTAILDTCALLITAMEGPFQRQAQLTFATGRHLLVDLGHVFSREKFQRRAAEAPMTRLDDDEFSYLCDLLRGTGVPLCGDLKVRERLDALRNLYEPHAFAMAEYLRLDLPRWTPPALHSTKPDIWASIAQLRSPSGSSETITAHVSPQATASHLGDEDAFI